MQSRPLRFLLFLVLVAPLAGWAGHRVERDVFYREADAALPAGDYRREQCRLDLYTPDDNPGFATVVWLHGGGLTKGRREFPRLMEQGLGLVSVGYRLSPRAEHPAYLEDAAAAVAWVLDNIAARGGDPARVFVAGHSAGGYLAAMVGMDPRWLAARGRTPSDLAGIIPVSGQVTTHFTVKRLRGDTGPEYRPVIDEYAPLYHAAKDLPPICLILGDRKVEYKNRVEENDLLAVALRNLGHPFVEFYELEGLNHSTVLGGAWGIIPGFVRRVEARAR